MKYLYDLEFYNWANADEMSTCWIGVFSCREDADATAKRYLRQVQGFCDYYCEYSVREAPLIGSRQDVSRVWTYMGWDETEDIYQVNILRGSFYTSRAAAREAMKAAKAESVRQHWLILDHKIGECAWAEGIVREYPNGRIAPTLAELRDGLRALTEPRTMCGIEFEYSDNLVYGFPLAVAEQLFLMAEDDDFILNGFTIRRLRDIYELSDRKGIYQSIAEKEGLTAFDVPDVVISDWKNVFASLEKLRKHIIVEREYDGGFFYIGTIEAVTDDHVLLRHYDADGIWQEEPVAVLYRDITSVSFGTRYAEVFSKYV